MVDSSSEFSMISGNISNVGFNKKSIGCSSTLVNTTEQRPSQKLHRTPSSRFDTRRSKKSRKAKRGGCVVTDSAEDGLSVAEQGKTKKRAAKRSIKLKKVKERASGQRNKNNTIRSVPIPKNKSDVDAFLDDIFNRALDSSQVEGNRATARKIQDKIKGGGGGFVRNDEAVRYWDLEWRKPEAGLAGKIKGGAPKASGNDSSYYSQFYASNSDVIAKEKAIMGEGQMVSAWDSGEGQVASPVTSQCVLKQVKLPKSDIQARAKTVRIGKVRWPPPIKESELFENEIQR